MRAKLVDAATRIQAARLLTYRAASLKDAGARFTLESAMAKLYSSEIAVRASEDGVQIHGGYGFVKDYPAEKFFRDVKLTTIGEGTSEIQRLVIARQLLALDKSSEPVSQRRPLGLPPDELIARIRDGDPRAVARAISLVENGAPAAERWSASAVPAWRPRVRRRGDRRARQRQEHARRSSGGDDSCART